MKKALVIVLGVLGLAIVAVAGAASMQPDQIHVERSITVSATPTDMQPFAEDLTKVNEWSPWERRDPDMEKTYSEKTDAVGATYEWKGNEDVGHGRQTIKSIEPGKVVHTLEFFEPFEGQADASILYTRAGNSLNITWAYDQEADFPTRVMTLFMDMDAALGPDFEEGLGLLGPLVEKAAAERRRAEKKARAAAEAEAAVKAEAEAAAKAAADAAAASAADTGDAADPGGEPPADPTQPG